MKAAQRSARRVVIHVGAPKSGTTFLQRAMWTHRDGLQDQGVRLPGLRERDMFHAAIEVREAFRFWGFEPETLAGTWRTLCQEARSYSGSTIMSHELLGSATEEQVARALAELEGEEVHLVYTARDLARQVTSEWQERIKNGSTRTFEGFRKKLSQQIRDGDFSDTFWRAHDVAGVLGRWGAALPPDRVHVVVCPPSGASPQELWTRFGEACGFDSSSIDPTAGNETRNQTLGVVEASVLRRVNKALDGRIRQPQYAQVVKHQFAQGTLAGLSSASPRVPADLLDQLRPFAEERNATLVARGYTVHGDLAELLPADPHESARVPGDFDISEELEASIAVIAEMLVARAERVAARPKGAALSRQPMPGLVRRLLQRASQSVRRSGHE